MNNRVENLEFGTSRAFIPGLEIASEIHPFVSVVIPVYEDVDALAKCLDGFCRQTYPAHRFEVIVVDNGSSRDLTWVTAKKNGASLVRCAIPGSYAARNRGVAASLGPILAFTDADCRPRPEWIESAVAAFRRMPEAAAIGGAIEIIRGPGALSAAELHQRVWAFPQRNYLERSRFVATANLFTYKSVFEGIGPFDERLLSSGDLEWGQRAHGKGYRMIFCPEVVTDHPPRTTVRALLRKQRRIVGGQFTLRQLRGQRHYDAVIDIGRRLLERTLGRHRPAQLAWPDRVRVAAVEWFIAGTRLLEILRLLLGGAPRRH